LSENEFSADLTSFEEAKESGSQLTNFYGKAVFAKPPSRSTWGTRRRQDAKKERRNSFHLILLGVFAPLRGPTKASLYQGHGADLLASHPDFQLLTKKTSSSCEKRDEAHWLRQQEGQIGKETVNQSTVGLSRLETAAGFGPRALALGYRIHLFLWVSTWAD